MVPTVNSVKTILIILALLNFTKMFVIKKANKNNSGYMAGYI
jgi:hypothetical protein